MATFVVQNQESSFCNIVFADSLTILNELSAGQDDTEHKSKSVHPKKITRLLYNTNTSITKQFLTHAKPPDCRFCGHCWWLLQQQSNSLIAFHLLCKPYTILFLQGTHKRHTKAAVIDFWCPLVLLYEVAAFAFS